MVKLRLLWSILINCSAVPRVIECFGSISTSISFGSSSTKLKPNSQRVLRWFYGFIEGELFVEEICTERVSENSGLNIRERILERAERVSEKKRNCFIQYLMPVQGSSYQIY